MEMATPVIGILRGIDSAWFGEVLAASFAAGLEALEVTINTPGALAMISRHRATVPSGKQLGMGTIRTLAEAQQAVDVGAMFLVSPNLDTEVVRFAKGCGIGMVVGALTPTEVYQGWAAGADLVKVFPCQALGGPRYLRDLRGPFGQIPMVAVGGVTLDNLDDYFAAGAWGVGVGASLFGARGLRERDSDMVHRNVARFIKRCRGARDRL